jgi:hypothetical protein
MSGVPQWLIYTVLGVVVLVWAVARQLREREVSPRQLLLLPGLFLVLAFTDRKLGHDLDSATAIGMLGAGLVLAAVTGVARAWTMRIRRVGGRVLAKGNGLTLTLWVVTILVRVGEVAAAYALGIHEGTGEAMLFAAATFGAQGAVLAWRAGLVGTAPGRIPAVEERIG